VDFALYTVKSTLFDAVFIPGGQKSVTALTKGDVIGFINEAYKHFKAVGASGEGVQLLQKCSMQGGIYHSFPLILIPSLPLFPPFLFSSLLSPLLSPLLFLLSSFSPSQL
jgi:hypothetical protein